MISITDRQRRYFSYANDVLLFIVVLNLFVEYVDAVIIDSFTISIFTAIVLKIILDLLLAFEHRVSGFFKEHNRPLFGALAVWLILFSSKFVILEIIDIIFGEHVELGGFLSVLALVATMMIARAVFQRIYQSLGDTPAEA
jgi:hypothetical protein